MKIGDRIYVRGYVDEIRKDTVIVRNNGGYFGTIPSEVITGELPSAQSETHEERTETHACDCISRQAAIDALDGEIEITGRTNAEAVKGYVRLVRDRLERLPSAQPVKHGVWFGTVCSCCGESTSDSYDCEYCPNCGARMDGEVERRNK